MIQSNEKFFWRDYVLNVQEKLSAMAKKIQELDQLSNEWDKLEEDKTIETNKIMLNCLTQGTFDAADELDELIEDLTEEDFEEIEAALDEVEAEIEKFENEIEETTKDEGELSTNLIEPLHNLASLYHISERYDEEISARKKILEILKNFPNAPKAHIILALRELVYSLKIADYMIESNLIRHQMFAMYKKIFNDEVDENIDVLIDAMQKVLSMIEEFEVFEEIDIASELYNLMIKIDTDIFEYKEEYFNLTPLTAACSIAYLLYHRKFQSQAEDFIREFPILQSHLKFKF